VDDEPSIRRTTRRILEHEGYTVIESANGVDALLQVERSAPDIVVTDLHMPGCDGFDLTRSVRNRASGRPQVLVLSGDDGETVTRQASALGATTLMKPFTREELVTAVRSLTVSPLRDRRILIVDDQPDVCQALRYLLETEGLVVADAASGREALEYLGAHSVDVILTDLYMPGMDGLELLRALRNWDRAAPPVVVYTGSALVDRELVLEQARGLGACTTLEKPLAAATLFRAIGAAVSRSAA
jgi:CheY-like chemotaxis protein